MAYFLQLAFAGIALGCIYALIGLGFSIIFKASEVINFAQGELLLVGAYVVSAGFFEWHLPFLVAFLVGILVTTLIGLIFERVVLRRMIGRPVFSILMITIGLDTILRTGVIVRWGSNTLPAASPFTITSGFNPGGVHLGANDLWTIGVTVVLCAGLFAFFRYTRYGLAMRATALDQEAAQAVGINIRTVYALAWMIAAAIATVGGVFLAIGSVAIDPTLGDTALLAFPAIILGGIDSISGAVVGGIIIGLAEVLTAGYESHVANLLGAGIHEITPYLIMILVLLFRPYGLFGTRKVERI
ncbi:MAG TPA: branched-chain amino acid ABC transporter permease [Ktedonobacteraceae bacterium]|nr:branched-chain amino acid ABC transporter permease [Ktedonobacteraceae bacterium]